MAVDGRMSGPVSAESARPATSRPRALFPAPVGVDKRLLAAGPPLVVTRGRGMGRHSWAEAAGPPAVVASLASPALVLGGKVRAVPEKYTTDKN